MKSNADRMIENLAPQIDRKCAELRAARRERMQARMFALLCIAVLLIPALLVLAGVSLTLLIAPLAFMSLSAILLLPVLLSDRTANRGGAAYERA